MPFYGELRHLPTDEQIRIYDRLIALREKLHPDAENGIPAKGQRENLLLATWNLREFDSPKYGKRLDESYYYIAEIIDRFDLVALQEVNRNPKALRKLVDILGDNWRYLVTDVTDGQRGNGERMAFLYDSTKVKFGGLSGELVLPPIRRKGQTTEPIQFARTPFICGFEVEWVSFMLTTVHIIYGSKKADDERRVREIEQVSERLIERLNGPNSWSRNMILLGDFNIFRKTDKTMAALKKSGFQVPEELQDLPSNALRNKHYDQIAMRNRQDRFEPTGRAGVVDFFDVVFRDDDEALYEPIMGADYRTTKKGEPRSNPTRYYKEWRTHQVSDHLPMWIELKINFADDYLESIAG